jgi:hypothetical protein
MSESTEGQRRNLSNAQKATVPRRHLAGLPLAGLPRKFDGGFRASPTAWRIQVISRLASPVSQLVACVLAVRPVQHGSFSIVSSLRGVRTIAPRGSGTNEAVKPRRCHDSIGVPRPDGTGFVGV